MVDPRERLVDVQARYVGECRAENRAEPDVHRPHREADDERDEEEAGRDKAGAKTDAAGLYPRRSLHPLRGDSH